MEILSKEQIVMELIVNSGDARSKAMGAIKIAKKGDLQAARAKIKEANAALNKAHNIQTSLIQGEAAGEEFQINLLMIHAQDHLMNAITIRDLALEVLDIYEEVRK